MCGQEHEDGVEFAVGCAGPAPGASVLRVLYVEDDPGLRGILTAILGSRRDLEIVVTTGGRGPFP